MGGICRGDPCAPAHDQPAKGAHSILQHTPVPANQCRKDAPPQTHPISAKVLALHGWDDPMATPEDVVAFAAEMTGAGADWHHRLHLAEEAFWT